jgi:hypothetical protein
MLYVGQAMTQWLRHCATNRKVAGSNPDSVIGIFHVPIVLKSGSLNLLEPSRPVKAFNEIALPYDALRPTRSRNDS